jgi:hypothetical protein
MYEPSASMNCSMVAFLTPDARTNADVDVDVLRGAARTALHAAA